MSPKYIGLSLIRTGLDAAKKKRANLQGRCASGKSANIDQFIGATSCSCVV
jgi:hypothetical protein